MGTAIILVILFVIALFALKGTFKHLSGQGDCCGGSRDPLPKKKRIKRIEAVTDVYLVKIDGMHCNHCKESVENALEELEGVTVKVHLKKGEALVQAAGNLEEGIIREAVKKAGFSVIDIKRAG
ncbi:MAG: heavy-metal-associated domain-containing protein [Lachnospiraceae bacterium]|nr:heavy-metal-associated domain-containing protein [Lachnospiraceae bacterium]